MSRRSIDDTARWLEDHPSLEDLAERFPDDWLLVQEDVATVIERDDPEELKAYMSRAAQSATVSSGRARSRRDRLSAEIRRQMTLHLLKQAILSASTGVTEGRVRFGLVNGFLAQKLLFRRGLERKPVSMWQFRMIWPLLRQRRLLMPLVQPKGIWCFYSQPLITELAKLIGDRSCLEIAAGDGTLTRFLTDAGVRVTATDSYDWSNSIEFPESVLHQDAKTALRVHRPEVVLCSWPPAGNPFERHVFTTPGVQTYIVIGSGQEVSTGDWAAYRNQTAFDWHTDERLSRLVLPPNIDHAVLVFSRKQPA